MLLSKACRIVTAAYTSGSLLLSVISGPSWASDEYYYGPINNNVPLASCSAESNCVSSNYLEPPNRYISPLKLVKDRDIAFRQAVRDISAAGKDATSQMINLVKVDPNNYYIHLAVPGTALHSEDDIELVFTADGTVNLKCQAQVTLPPPPFCLKKNCINGNMDQRLRLESISRNTLGLPFVDDDLMKEDSKWTPIFFNSDRVPHFDDE